MTGSVRIAVVGLGFMGSGWAQAIADHDGATLAAVCDVDEARAKSAGERFGCQWRTDPAETAGGDVDGVVVCTPDHLHEQASLAALAAGHALAVEKPFAHDVATSEKIRDAAGRAGIPVLAAHILRFEPRYAAIRAAIDEGRIGQVQAVRSERIGVLGDQDVLKGRVSVPLYYGTHELDLACWYAGDIASVYAARSSGVLHAAGFDQDDLYSVTLNFASGAHGTSMIGWLLPTASSGPGLAGYTVIGEHGYLRVLQGLTGLVANDASGAFSLDTWYSLRMHGRSVGALANQVDHFVHVVRGDIAPLVTAADGTEAVRASLAVEQSAAERRVVELVGAAT